MPLAHDLATRRAHAAQTTLKRKRDAVDDADDEPPQTNEVEVQAALPAIVVTEPAVDAMDVAVQADVPAVVTSAVPDATPAVFDVAPTVLDAAPAASDPDLAAPPTKRRKAMRIVSGVAKTTAIAAVGAVAAWSALAYS